MLTFFGCMGTIHWNFLPPSSPTPQLNFGLTVMVIVHIFGHISNALINPAVSVAAVINKMISWQVNGNPNDEPMKCVKLRYSSILILDWNIFSFLTNNWRYLFSIVYSMFFF